MRTIDGRSYAEDEDARRLENVIFDTTGLPVKLRVVDGRLEVVIEKEREERDRLADEVRAAMSIMGSNTPEKRDWHRNAAACLIDIYGSVFVSDRPNGRIRS